MGFKPDLKFRITDWVIWPLASYKWPVNADQVSNQFVLGKIVHVNVYNRNNIKYLIRVGNEVSEVDKDYLEKYGKAGKNQKALEVLYGTNT